MTKTYGLFPESEELRKNKSRKKTPEQMERDKIRARERRARVKAGNHVVGEAGGFSESVKNRDLSTTIDCPNCQRVFHPRYGRETDYCCSNCWSESQWKHYEQCSRCHALAGMGYRASGKAMGVSGAVIQRIRKRKGIKAALPNRMGWSRVKTEIHVEQDRQKDLYTKYERAWMHEVRSAKKFPDWSIVWTIEKARESTKASSLKRYHSMNDEAKKQWNRRCLENRKKKWAEDPEAKKRDQDRIQQWKRENPEKAREYMKQRKKADPGYRVQCNMRNRLKDLMQTTKKGGSYQISKLIGCTTQQLAAHLESKFTKQMTWENYGTYWHVDHVLPCSSFDHTVNDQVRQCWHWTNLAPLDARKNLNKSDRITSPQMNLLLCSTH